MKTKLLKKVRSRYSITHYPKGVEYYGHLYTEPLTILTDAEDSWRSKLLFGTKAQTFDGLYVILVGWIKKDYVTTKKKKPQILPSEQLWYKK
jgi:hypothetical protein